MKKIMFLLAMLPMMCFGQDILIDENTKDVSIIGTCELTKKDKYSNVKEWVAKTYGDYKSVVQYEDAEECKIIIKGISQLKSEESSAFDGLVHTKLNPSLNYTITIECKDDKYRFFMDGISVGVVKESSVVLSSPTKTRNQYDINEYVNLLVDGEYTNPEETRDRLLLKLESERANLNSLENINKESLKKKAFKKISEDIQTTKKTISSLEQDLIICEYWINKESRRLADIKSKVLLLYESLSNMICRIDEW